MKKNIMAVIILATTLINLTLTVVTLFIVIPNASRTNNLITKVLSVIDLELESATAEENQVISIEDIATYKIADDMTINLRKTEGDTKTHYAIVNCSLSLNKKSEDYESKQPLLAEQEGYIRETVQTEISNYTIEDIHENKENIKTAIQQKLAERFQSDFIIGVSFSTFIAE